MGILFDSGAVHVLFDVLLECWDIDYLAQIPSTNTQIPNNNQIPMTEIPNLDELLFGAWDLEFGAYLGFGACDLLFVPINLNIISLVKYWFIPSIKKLAILRINYCVES